MIQLSEDPDITFADSTRNYVDMDLRYKKTQQEQRGECPKARSAPAADCAARRRQGEVGRKEGRLAVEPDRGD